MLVTVYFKVCVRKLSTNWDFSRPAFSTIFFYLIRQCRHSGLSTNRVIYESGCRRIGMSTNRAICESTCNPANYCFYFSFTMRIHIRRLYEYQCKNCIYAQGSCGNTSRKSHIDSICLRTTFSSPPGSLITLTRK